MNQQLGPEAGRVLRRKIEELGIRVHTGVRTRGLRGTDRVTGVELPDGSVLDADFVVVAAGIRPNTDVAVRSGLEVQRGVVVDDRMQCSAGEEGEEGSVDGVYAVGECVQHRGQTYGLVAPLWDQAGVLADHLTGSRPDAAYHGSRTSTKLKVAGVDVVAMGLSGPSATTTSSWCSPNPTGASTSTSSSATGAWSGRRCWATCARPPSSPRPSTRACPSRRNA